MFKPSFEWKNTKFTVLVRPNANGRSRYQQLPTLLGVAGQQCCVRLHAPKSLTGFKLYATSANKYQHCSGSMQTDATSHNIVGCCWPTMLGLFAWAFSGYRQCAAMRMALLPQTADHSNSASFQNKVSRVTS